MGVITVSVGFIVSILRSIKLEDIRISRIGPFLARPCGLISSLFVEATMVAEWAFDERTPSC